MFANPRGPYLQLMKNVDFWCNMSYIYICTWRFKRGGGSEERRRLRKVREERKRCLGDQI